VVRRGQLWTLVRGGNQYRALIVSNDEYNLVDDVAIWALTVVQDVARPSGLTIRLRPDDPLSGAYVRIPSVLQLQDRSALRDNHGFVSHDTMNVVENALREFLELP
jgi:mRNA-degrading endonuclease toxin of MazEF toxin-antitoxin module